MRVASRLAVAVTLFASSILVAGETGSKSPPVSSLTFRTEGGTTVAWKDVAGKNATVVVFLSFDCPMSTSYAKPLADLAKQYASRGVTFVGLCPCDETTASVAKHANDFQLGFPMFKDEKLAAADALGAKLTPQVFVLDAKNAVRYSGLIDDGYVKRLVPSKKVSEHYLTNAIDAVLAGKPVAVAKTEPLGCAIVREARRGSSTEVTYYRDVLPVLQNRCQSCHRPGEVGPFSLMTYKQAVNWADDIKEFTANHKMPPWKPTGGHEFVGDRRLSDKEVRTLAKWADNNCPEGDLKDAPPAKTFVDGWFLGKPDLILTVNEDFVLGPTGKDHFRVYVLPTGLTEDKFVVAVELRPGNPKIVHHALNFYDATGNARKMERDAREKLKDSTPGPDAVDVGPGYPSAMGIGFRVTPADLASGKPPIGALGGWAPGILPKYLPEGTGYFLPKGSDFVMQIHYHRDGRLEKDRTQVGLYFAKKPVDKPMLGIVVPGRFKTDDKATGGRFSRMGYIPAGDEHFVGRGAALAMEDCTIHLVTPHMHLLGKSIKITMTPPDGKPETLIDIAEWDYNWQETYKLKEPIHVKKGTRFDIEAVFDNSAKNPNNPSSPPVNVPFGEQTTSEMLFGFLGATKDSRGLMPYLILQRPIQANEEAPKR